MYYTAEISSHWDSRTRSQLSQSVDYEYWLELDKKDRIVGGTWVTYDRPDFLWTQTQPEFTGIYKVLKNLYEMSIQNTNVSV